jgi:hypothetical protein
MRETKANNPSVDSDVLQNGDEVLAQSEKLRLEALQRADLKLREETAAGTKA